MALKINTEPSVEPLSLAEVKMHLRLDSGELDDILSTEITIAPGSHAVVADYGLQGDTVDLSGYNAIVNLVAGNCGSGGTVDVKLQESDDDSTWADVESGSFTQVTESNDNAVQEKAYTGSCRYIRIVATVATAACEFSVEVVLRTGYTAEDDLLNALITAARKHAEDVLTRRAFITQTWELWLDKWPSQGYIEIPRPPLQSISSVKYYDTSDTEATFSSSYYFVDTKSEPGRLCLNYNESWPTTTLRPHNGICVNFVAGYGDAASNIPQDFRRALLLLIGHFYEHREEVITGSTITEVPMAAKSLLMGKRVY